jgi:hypothetical protein
MMTLKQIFRTRRTRKWFALSLPVLIVVGTELCIDGRLSAYSIFVGAAIILIFYLDKFIGWVIDWIDQGERE